MEKDLQFTPHRELGNVQKGNQHVKWGQFGAENTDEKLASVRLRRNVLQLGGEPKFALTKSDRFFTIGSCFARGLENILMGKKLAVESFTQDFLKWRTINENTTPLGATNRYNTASIANDFRWHLDPESTFPKAAFLEAANGLFTDPHMNPTLAPASVEELMERRRIWGQVFGRMPDVDVVILTLGLVEAWYDHETELVLNSAPDPRAIRRDRDRFSFVKLNFSDNLENLEAIRAVLSNVCKPGFRMVVTVSPVPLMRTFTDQDIIVANCYSKSTLRSAAQEFADRHDNVAYFPSYEIAINSDPKEVWHPTDRRHVNGAFSKQIMRQFFETYFTDVVLGNELEYTIKQLG